MLAFTLYALPHFRRCVSVLAWKLSTKCRYADICQTKYSLFFADATVSSTEEAPAIPLPMQSGRDPRSYQLLVVLLFIVCVAKTSAFYMVQKCFSMMGSNRCLLYRVCLCSPSFVVLYQGVCRDTLTLTLTLFPLL